MRPLQVIYLTPRDTVGIIRELLYNASPGSQVWLVMPWRSRVALNLVHLRLIRRLADRAALDLRLVSVRPTVRTLAREAGLPVHFMVPDELRQYRTVRRTDAAGLAARVIPVREQLAKRFEHRPQVQGVGAVVLTLVVVLWLVGAMGLAGLALFPSATIVLSPVAKPVVTTFEVRADTDVTEIDLRRGHIPARSVQVIVQGRSEIPASGRTDVADGHASGVVVFANRTREPIRVPKSTVVRTSSGATARFYTMADVEVPGTLFGTARVGVLAAEPGPNGNVLPMTINAVEGAIANQVEVLNDSATQGGSTRRVPVVAIEDFDRLREQLANELQKEAYSQLVAQLADDEFIPSAALQVEVMSQQFDQVADQRSDVLSMSMKVVARGIAVDGLALRELAEQRLAEIEDEELAVIEDSVIAEPAGEINLVGQQIQFGARAVGQVAPVTDVNRVRSAVTGKTRSQALRWLSENLQLGRPPQIEIEPTWWERMPWLTMRIHVTISAGDA